MSELAAAMIDQRVNGITKDPLWSDALAEIGKRVLPEEDFLVSEQVLILKIYQTLMEHFLK